MPLVHTSTVGRPSRFAIPSAKNAADRSSSTGIAAISGCRTKANVSGVDRDPGEITACRTPSRLNVSASTLHQSEFTLLKSK